MSQASQKQNIDTLTSLRGVAALLIVVHHMGLLMLPLRPTVLGAPLGKFGVLGMSVFFVLSGFVIHYNYARTIHEGREQGVLSFLFARFARLYPLYFAFVVGNFILNTISAPNAIAASTYAASFPAYLAGMQSWWYAALNNTFMGESQEYANNSWSISTELFLYLLYIPLALALRFEGRIRAAFAILGLAATGRIIFVLAAHLPVVEQSFQNKWGAADSVPVSFWLSYLSPYGRFWEFLAGVGVAELWSATRNRKSDRFERLLMLAFGGAALAYLVLSLFDTVLFSQSGLFDNRATYVGYSLAIPVLIYLLCRLNWRRPEYTKWMCAKPLLFMGEISYSLYLLHSNLWPLFRVQAADASGSLNALNIVGKSIAFLAVLIAFSWGAYVYLEMPARKRILAFYRKCVSLPASHQDAGSTGGAVGVFDEQIRAGAAAKEDGVLN